MRFGGSDFMSFMGYRNMIVEGVIEECLAAARRGESFIEMPRGDLTQDEIQYIQQEIQRRIESGNY